jgi:predicted RNA binding protein YcfA (HicA-like mRNA interferase family)
MKTGGARGLYIHRLVSAIEQVGYSLARRSSSHFIFRAPNRPNITIPQKLDCVHTAKKIAKVAGVSLE